MSLQKLSAAITEIEQLEELHRKVSSVLRPNAQSHKTNTVDLPENLRTVPEDCQLLLAPIKNLKNKLSKLLNNELHYHIKHYSKEEKGIVMENKEIFTFLENCSKGNDLNPFQLDEKRNPFAGGWTLGNLKDYLPILQKAIEDLSLAPIFGLDNLFLFLDEVFRYFFSS